MYELVADLHQQTRESVPQESDTIVSAPESPMGAAVMQAITAMEEDPSCTEGVSGIARDTFYSKFHFTREFANWTGTTPRRYLSALRMNQAKSLLLETDFGIADICFMVGYSSVGTFSTRFSAMVGTTPRDWRRNRGQLSIGEPTPGTGGSTLRGMIFSPEMRCSPTTRVFVGVFEDSIIQGTPAAWTYAGQAGEFELNAVPDGAWRIAVACQAETAHGDVELRGYSDEIRTVQGQTGHFPVTIGMSKRSLLSPPCVREGLLPSVRTQNAPQYHDRDLSLLTSQTS